MTNQFTRARARGPIGDGTARDGHDDTTGDEHPDHSTPNDNH